MPRFSPWFVVLFKNRSSNDRIMASAQKNFSVPAPPLVRPPRPGGVGQDELTPDLLLPAAAEDDDGGQPAPTWSESMSESTPPDTRRFIQVKVQYPCPSPPPPPYVSLIVVFFFSVEPTDTIAYGKFERVPSRRSWPSDAAVGKAFLRWGGFSTTPKPADEADQTNMRMALSKWGYVAEEGESSSLSFFEYLTDGFTQRTHPTRTRTRTRTSGEQRRA
jgi:hypothetical protein